MKTKILLSTLIIVASWGSGCTDSQARKDVAALRAELREHRFEYSDPKLEVAVLKTELLPADSEYSDPKVRLTGVVRQKGEYSLSTYTVQMELRVTLSDDSTHSVRAEVEMKEKSGVFTGDATLYRARKAPVKIKSVDLAQLGWWRPSSWKTFATFTAQAKPSE